MVKTYIVHNKQIPRVMLNLEEHNGIRSRIFYTVSLEIINQQSQETVYNDFKDFCQKCAILLNAIYREAIRQQNCLKLLNIIILIEIQSYSNYKIHRHHNLLLLLRSSIVVGYGFNLYKLLKFDFYLD
jgi:hypothetical protein